MKSEKKSFKIRGNLIDIFKSSIYPAEITVAEDKIKKIKKLKSKVSGFISPGFIDSHIHIESSMLPPAEFARFAVVHGTVATVSDPHEIANVLGIKGVEYMLDSAKQVPFKFYFGASPCVPATSFETAGASLGVTDIKNLLSRPEIKYLSEMMNYPGVVHDDPDVLAKIAVAKSLHKPIDGHAPGLAGNNLQKYISSGISTDHETYDLNNARQKISLGMKIIIREGSAAKNFEILHPLLKESPQMCMLCCDDHHTDDLLKGHINILVKRALDKGYDLIDVIKTVTLNPVNHYGLEVGLLREGDPADFILIDNFDKFNITATYINGRKVAENGKSLLSGIRPKVPNNFNLHPKKIADFRIPANGGELNVIEARDDALITGKVNAKANIINGNIESDVTNDILKIVVVNRYNRAPVSIAFIRNFGLKKGAIAASVAHDSHNIIAVGVSDADIKNAVNILIKHKGGLSLADGKNILILPLAIAGLMSELPGDVVAAQYEKLTSVAKKLGSKLHAPYMTLSFMALLVIPSLKISDKGLFDGDKFRFISLSS